MEEHPLLTILRNKETPIDAFRHAADTLSYGLAQEVYTSLERKAFSIETPMAKTTGYALKNACVIVPILRSGLVMLAPFLSYFSSATVGVMGLRRNEKTKQPEVYYNNLPEFGKEDELIIIDPMLATGGTAIRATEEILKSGHPQSHISFCGIIASSEGLKRYQEMFPNVRTTIAKVDPELNGDKFIVPGLGDFGDRYFGTIV